MLFMRGFWATLVSLRSYFQDHLDQNNASIFKIIMVCYLTTVTCIVPSVGRISKRANGAFIGDLVSQ